MNGNMINGALNGIVIDGVFVPNDEIEERTFTCEHCGEVHLIDNATVVDGEDWCDGCVDEDSFVCDRCGERHNWDDSCEVQTRYGREIWCSYCDEYYAFTCEDCGERYDEVCGHSINDDGAYVCDDCFENYRECDECGALVRDDEVTEVYFIYDNGDREARLVCEYCRDEHYTECTECGEWFNDECFEPFSTVCGECESQPRQVEEEHEHTSENYGNIVDWSNISNTEPTSDNARVRPYHSAPPTMWFGDEHKGMGIELEIDCVHSNEYRQRLLNILDTIAGEHLYFERDGSLNNGFEIITQPHTVEAFHEVDWESILRACRDNGYQSHDAGTCGLHVHFSREMFGADTETQDDNISKLIQFVDMHWDDIVKCSRRTDSQLSNWARKKGTLSKKKIKEDVKYKNGGRYQAINNTNLHTVEFRFMRGTLNYKSFMACIDLFTTMVKNICRIDWGDVCEASEVLKGISDNTKTYLSRQNAFYEARLAI